MDKKSMIVLGAIGAAQKANWIFVILGLVFGGMAFVMAGWWTLLAFAGGTFITYGAYEYFVFMVNTITPPKEEKSKLEDLYEQESEGL